MKYNEIFRTMSHSRIGSAQLSLGGWCRFSLPRRDGHFGPGDSSCIIGCLALTPWMPVVPSLPVVTAKTTSRC